MSSVRKAVHVDLQRDLQLDRLFHDAAHVLAVDIVGALVFRQIRVRQISEKARFHALDGGVDVGDQLLFTVECLADIESVDLVYREVLALDQVVQRVLSKLLDELREETAGILDFVADQDLDVLFVLLAKFHERFRILRNLRHSHSDPGIKVIRIRLRHMVRKAQDLKSFLYRLLDVFALRALGMVTADRMCMVIGNHKFSQWSRAEKVRRIVYLGKAARISAFREV